MGTTWPSWCPVEHRIARQAASRKTEECRNQALWYLLSIFVLGCASSYLVVHLCAWLCLVEAAALLPTYPALRFTNHWRRWGYTCLLYTSPSPRDSTSS
eukprot:10408109-Prorocentrum_lima.AAC.1